MKPLQTTPTPPRPHAGDPINETLMRRIVDAVRSGAMSRPGTPGSASRFGVTMPHNGSYPADDADALVYPFRFVGLKNVDDKTTGEFLQKSTESADDWDTAPIGEESTIPDGFAVHVAAAHGGSTIESYIKEGDIIPITWNGSFYEIAYYAPQSGIIIMTPSGGIPARSGTTVGKADCEIYSIDGDDKLVATGVSVSVVNIAAEAVQGSVYGQAKRAGGRWVIDYEECE